MARPSVRVAVPFFLLSALVALACAGPASGAQPATAAWHYRLSILDPASGKVHVDLSIAGLQGTVTAFTFATPAHREPVTDVVCGPESGRCYCPAAARLDKPTKDGDEYDRSLCYQGSAAAGPARQVTDVVALHVDGDESFSYDVAVSRPAFVAGQELAHAGADFALFKAESIAIEYRYSFYQGMTFTNRTTVELAPPAGWSARGPWRETGAANAYELPGDAVLPRGYVVFGKFLATEERDAGGKRVHYVRLGKPASFESGLYDYIDKASAYYAAVYGPGTHEDVLVVNAPDPMFRGGLGGADSFFVHESADLRTVAHEYAHVFQQFGTDERAGSSSIWINEGDADLHSAYSLYAADVWTPQDVNDFLHAAQRDRTDRDLASARLPDATYGSPLERFAYHKGSIVLAALDDLMKRDSGGQVGLSDVLRRLNAMHGGGVGSAEEAAPVTTAQMRSVSEGILGEDLGDFFGNFVYGTKWPDIAAFVPQGEIVVSDLTLEPARASPGEPVVVRALATNRGTTPLARLVDLSVDGEARAQRTNVSLDVGATQPLEFRILAGAPGDHEVRILDARATLHALTPPHVTLLRASTVPNTLRAGEEAQLLVYLANDGETPGTAYVRALDPAGDTLAASTQNVVDANGTEVLTLPLRIAAAGALNVTLVLETPQGDTNATLALQVAPPPPSDEVPGILSGDGKGVPAPPAWLVASALAGGALVLRRRRA